MRVIELARERGVTLSVSQGRIVARPAQAITPELRDAITAHKSALIAHLSNAIPDPGGPCPECGCGQFWQLPGAPWHCRQCEPMSGAERARATTLTVDGQLPVTQRAPHHTRLDAAFETACQGISITPERLQRELSDDLHAIASGELTARGPRQVAETLSACRLPDPQAEAPA